MLRSRNTLLGARGYVYGLSRRNKAQEETTKMSVHDWEHIGLQMFVVATLGLKCNKCGVTGQFKTTHLSFATDMADRDGWVVDDACRVSCPECKDKER